MPESYPHISTKSYFVFVKTNLKCMNDIKTFIYKGETKTKVIIPLI